MAVMRALDEDEKYLAAILDDPSGIELAELTWVDEEAEDRCYRLWDFQYVMYGSDEIYQIDQCFPTGTLVLTEDGQVPIEEVQVGQRVLTHTGQWKNVLQVHDRGLQDLVSVSGHGHYGLRTTVDHEFYTRKFERRRTPELQTPQWTKASELLTGTENHHKWASPAWIEALPMPGLRHDTSSGRVNRLDHIDDPDVWWLVGLWVAEGSLGSSYGRAGKINRAVWSVNIDVEAKLTATLDRLGLNWNVHHPVQRSTQVAIVTVHSQQVANFLLDIAGRGAAHKHLHPSVHRLPHAYRQALMDGMLDGDGTVSSRGAASYSTISKALAVDLRLLAQGLGWQASMRHVRSAGPGSIEGRTVMQRDLYAVSLAVEPSRPVARIDGDHAWSKIQKIRPAGKKQQCWDLEVQDDHSYVAEGVVVHNCGRSLGKSVGIIMRAYAFPFHYPGAEMLITAPELNHLRPIVDKVENLFITSRLGREMLPKRKGMGITHTPQFQATFINNSRIVSRLPNRDGKGVKGSVGQLSLIQTTRGLVAAPQICVGDQVLTDAGRYMPVRHVYSYPANTVTVSGAGHRGMQVSANHRFLARRNINPQRSRNLSPELWTPVDDSQLSRHYWASPTEFPQLQLPALPCGITDGVNFLELVGRYVADGALGGTDKHGERTQVAFCDDADDIGQVEKLAASVGLRTGAPRSGTGRAVSVAINSIELVRWLTEHFGHLAEGKNVPSWLLGAPTAARQAFLTGYLAGDGHWSEAKQRWEAGSASKALALGVKMLAQSLGYNTAYSWVDPKVTHIAGVKLKKPPQRSHRIQISDHGHGVFEDRRLWGKIRKVEDAGEAIVYDFAVLDDHSYVADGIIHMGTPFMPDGSEA